MLDWNEMVVYVKVVEEGSFVGAARSLGLPKSTISRKVARLEDRLGVRLLHRTTRVVRTTAVGQAYYERCAALVAEAADAERLVTSRQEKPSGTLKITVSVLFGQRHLAPVVTSFMQAHPDVNVELLLVNRFVDLVDEGYDLAIRAGTLTEADLVARRLGPVYMVLVASPAYLASRREPASPADLARHECIVVSNETRSLAWPLGGDRVAVKGRLAVNDLEIARDAALAGLGIARVPSFLVGDELADGRLVRVLPQIAHDNTGIYAVYPTRKHLSAAVRAFVDHAVQAFAENPPWLLPDDPR